MRFSLRFLIPILLVALLGSADARAEDSCKVCDPAKTGELNSCFKGLLSDPTKCFEVPVAGCDDRNLPQIAVLSGKSNPLALSCDGTEKLKVEVDAVTLPALKDTLLTFRPAPALVFSGKVEFNGPLVAAPACVPCTSGAECFATLLKDPTKCFDLPATCSIPLTPKLKIADQESQSSAVSASCAIGGTLTIKADPAELKKQTGKKVELSVLSGPIDVKATASYEAKKATTKTSATAGGQGGSKPTPLPMDIVPSMRRMTAFKNKKHGARYIFVHENLAIDPESDPATTETERVVVRFIARQAVICRYYATSDDKNEYKANPGRVGGREDLANILKSIKVGEKKSDHKLPSSCGYPLKVDPNGNEGDAEGQPVRYVPATVEGNEPAYIDFTFGPFTSDELAFHLFRHDRDFKGNDMEGSVKLPNHLRYVGWIDLVVLGSRTLGTNNVISVNKQNGTELTRLSVSDQRDQMDIAAQVKFFLACTGRGNGVGKPQDLQVAEFCFGFSSGLSLTHPTQRFYPLGVNFTFFRYLSVNGLVMLERGRKLAPGYNDGDLFSGSADHVPSHERIIPGLALGVGLDPTLLGDLIGKIIKAGL